MTSLIIVEPMRLAAITTSRGSGADNLRSADPKEVWADASAGSPATITVDLGAARAIDTIFLGYVGSPAVAATWSISAGLAGAGEAVLQSTMPLRVPDVAGTTPPMTHALWRGASRTVRYVAITVTQPNGSPAVTAGVLVIGSAFVARLGQEWGAGRRPIDTGTATALPSGGFAVVEGARKRGFSWTFGDLTIEEADQLDLIAETRGNTLPVLVIEDADRTAGLRSRIHYGLFERWRAYERRNRRQTRWEVGIEEWL